MSNELVIPDDLKCECYTSHNLNTDKDEHTLSRTCPVHLKEATSFYEELDRKCAEASAATKMLRERDPKVHDYQGCENDVVLLRERISRLEQQLANARKEALEEAANEIENQAAAPAPIFERMADKDKQKFARILLAVTARGIRALIAKEPQP